MIYIWYPFIKFIKKHDLHLMYIMFFFFFLFFFFLRKHVYYWRDRKGRSNKGSQVFYKSCWKRFVFIWIMNYMLSFLRRDEKLTKEFSYWTVWYKRMVYHMKGTQLVCAYVMWNHWISGIVIALNQVLMSLEQWKRSPTRETLDC